MDKFLEMLQTVPEIEKIIEYMKKKDTPIAVTNLQGVQCACVGAAVMRASNRPAVFVCSNEQEARRLVSDLAFLSGKKPLLLLSREWQLQPNIVVSHEWEQRRLSAFYRIAKRESDVIVTVADALTARTIPPQIFMSLLISLEIGAKIDINELLFKLAQMGYTSCDEVEGAGQFARRGGILDIFSPMMKQPIRCEFFDDEIDTIGIFDPITQRRTENIFSALILPAMEVLPQCIKGLPEKLEGLAKKASGKRKALSERLRMDAEEIRNGVNPGGMDRYLTAIYAEVSTAISYFPPDTLIFLSESLQIDERIKHTALQTRQDTEVLIEAGILAGEYAKLNISSEELYALLSKFSLIFSNVLPVSRYPLPPQEIFTLSTRQLGSYGGSLELVVEDLEQYIKNKVAVLVLCGSEGRRRNLQQLLEERGIPLVLSEKEESMPKHGEVQIAFGNLSNGCEWLSLKLAILTEGQITSAPRREMRVSKKEPSNRKKLQSYTDLSPGDFVVHVYHGIGRYVGMERMFVDGVEKDYIKITYAGNDSLYVPAMQLDQVSKYIGGGEEKPVRLNKLGGTEWIRRKKQAKQAARDLAKGLTQLYAERQRRPGFAFSPDSPWQQEFENAFPYEETEDQLQAVEEIKRDMESHRPMDRLLCGDVGYGKTEVAFRAIMKCILDGKQAAILTPTTLLAQQHGATAMSRFKDFPVKIEVLSRFTPSSDIKRILAQIRAGSIDLLIGTHKLLQKNIIFHDLGLLIIDEEQRFGVTHKERLKEISRQVDVLTLSATPIPRTLNMALSGLRDMSMIEEPPAGRMPVQTYVLEHNWKFLSDVMQRELDRGGQVYYLHNRIQNIDLTAAQIQALLGHDTRIAIAHGQMNEQELSHVMRLMMEGEIDILVCTTIIETGIDIPNVNTLIIEDADKMGLAQLHQIRGRIGRSTRRAYAYLTFQKGKILQETAAKRLTAIREYVEFGSGFKVALRDLEIRGAGNLLGAEQSGYLMSVGYDLYLRLLEEAVLEERGETRRIECAADLTIDANIPKSYVPSAEQRMDLYRRIAAIRMKDDADDILDELLDRYGNIPKSVLALLDVALLRATAAEVGISDISQRKDTIHFTLSLFQPEAVVALCSLDKYRNQLSLAAGDVPCLILRLPHGMDALKYSRDLVEDLRREEKRIEEKKHITP